MERITEIAWAAGILEGEGSFLLQTGTSYLKVQVHMTDLDVLESLQKIFGGNIHPITKRKSHWKDAWVWSLSGNSAYTCMKEVRPFMHSRRTQKIDSILEIRKKFEDIKQQELFEKTKLKSQVVSEYKNGSESIRGLAKIYKLNRGTVYRWILEDRQNLAV